jgi:hypothetical protein
MRIKYLVILMLFWSHSFSQRNASVVFEGKLVDSIDKQIDSILLVGTGSSTTRIFLDDLSQHLIKVLNNNGIEANYRYVGRTPTETQSAFDTINKKGYKAILFFLPKGSSFWDVQGNSNRFSSNTAIGTVNITTASSRIDYQQDFNFLLCISESKMKNVWTASVEVSGDLSKPKAANKVANKLVSDFKKNRYIK